METRVDNAYVTIHTNTAKPVGMVPLSINMVYVVILILLEVQQIIPFLLLLMKIQEK